MVHFSWNWASENQTILIPDYFCSTGSVFGWFWQSWTILHIGKNIFLKSVNQFMPTKNVSLNTKNDPHAKKSLKNVLKFLKFYQRESIKSFIYLKGHAGGIFIRYNVSKIQKIRNIKLWERYSHRRREVSEENHNQSNERLFMQKNCNWIVYHRA